jgi:hypothetical protein
MLSHCTESKTTFELSLPNFEAARAIAWKASRGFRSLISGALETRVCGDMDVVGCVLLAGFVAIVVHPVVYGNLGTSIVALMTPVR